MFKKLNYVLFIMLIMFAFTMPSFADTLTATATVEEVKSSVDSHDTNIAERAFPMQGGVSFPGLPGYFGDNNKPGHQFIPLDKLMMYSTLWEVKALHQYKGMKFNITPYKPQVAKENYSKFIRCTNAKFDTSKYNVVQLGMGTMNSTNKNTISSDLLATTLVNASKYGATHLQFLAEGTNTRLEAFGWGVGISYTKAGESAVGTGGTGISGGHSGYQNLPWVQFLVLKVTPKEGTVAAPGIMNVKMTPAQVENAKLDTQVKKAVQAKKAE